MAMNSNMKMIAGAAGAAVLVAAAYMAGSHRAAAPQEPETAAVSTGANAADEARAAKMAGNDAVAPKSNHNQQRSGDNGGYAGNGSNNAVAQEPARLCAECATVLSVHSENREGKGTGIGAVGGAVVGGLLGNQLGGGTGKKVATVGGAVAGGFAGNEIEKRTRASTVWVVKMRNADQTVRTMEFSRDPAVHNGDVVKVSNGQLVRQ